MKKQIIIDGSMGAEKSRVSKVTPEQTAMKIMQVVKKNEGITT